MKNIIVSVICGLFILWLGLPKVGTSGKKTAQIDRGSDPQAQMVARTQAPLFGMIHASVDKMQEWKVPRGWSVRFDPIDRIAYDYFIDGVKTIHYGLDKASTVKYRTVNVPYDHKEGLVISPGQDVGEGMFAITVYFGDEPPANWRSRAIAAGPLKS